MNLVLRRLETCSCTACILSGHIFRIGAMHIRSNPCEKITVLIEQGDWAYFYETRKAPIYFGDLDWVFFFFPIQTILNTPSNSGCSSGQQSWTSNSTVRTSWDPKGRLPTFYAFLFPLIFRLVLGQKSINTF